MIKKCYIIQFLSIIIIGPTQLIRLTCDSTFNASLKIGMPFTYILRLPSVPPKNENWTISSVFSLSLTRKIWKSPQKWYDSHPQNMLTCRLKLSFFVRYLLSYPKYDDLKQSLLWMGLILLLTGVTQPAKVIFIGFPIMDHVNHPFSGTPMAQTGRFSCVEPREGPKSSHSAESEPQGVANSTSANDTKKGLIAMVQQWLHKIT